MNSLALLFGPEGWGALLLQGAAVTISLAVATVPLGFGAGLALALLRGSRSRAVRAACNAYTTFFRGIPDLLALFIVYFGLQAVIDRAGAAIGIPHIEISAFGAGVVALGAIAAAYSGEVWLAALRAVPAGQREAAQSLGLGPARTFLSVLLPQLFRIAIPGLGNVWTILLKDTSLISTLAVLDLLRAASEAARTSRDPLLFYTAAAGIYLVLSIGSNIAQGWMERRSGRGHAA